ncbi:restriction endonuclease subunit S [Roseateles sp.]|uniref:restriction endonuclease subunit S n=1 Tax=Roseateles sp. TaxID=1971397 RepID=UPI003D106A78
MTGWPTKYLTEICRPRQWRTISQAEFTETGYPVYGANGRIGYYSQYNHEHATLLITCRGATCGTLNLSVPKAYVTGNAMALDDLSESVDLQFLYYALKHRGFHDVISGSAQPQITGEGLRKVRVPVPPLDEQRRIVDQLSRADGIVHLRHQAQQKAAALIPALCADMFGDPATNPKGLPIRTVRELVARFEGGKNLQAASEGSTDYRILKVSAVTSGGYIEAESKPTPDDYEPPSNHIVREGDMLFSRANTEQLVGATAVVRSTNGRTLLPDKLWRFVWAEPVEQAFMHALFQSAHVRQELGKLSSGTSASMRNISQAKLFELRLPVPPLAQQSVFARHAEGMLSIQSQQALALEKATATFDALLARAFSAERAADAVHEVEGAIA